MKNATLFLFLSCSLMVSAQQSYVKGVVSIHNSEYETGKRQYVPNAQIEDEFNKQQPATTYSDGNFEMVFVRVEPKTTVNLIVKKEGLQVVNINEVNMVTAYTGQTDLRVSMAKPERIAEYRRQIYKVGKTEAEKSLTLQLKNKVEQITALQRDAEKNKTSIEKLQKEYEDLQAFALKIDSQAQDLARRYAPINLDDMSPLYRKAFGYFQQGDLEKAMQILRDADLIGQAVKMKEKETKANNKIKEGIQELEDVKEKKPQLLQAFLFQADLYKTANKIDSARICFLAMLELDSNNFQLQYDYAAFLQINACFDESIIAYNAAYKKAKSNVDSIQTLLAIAYLYSGLGKINDAKLYFMKALNVDNKSNVASTLNIYKGLAGMYRKAFKYDSCDYYYTKALELARMNVDNKKFRKYKARTYDEIGQYYASRLLYQNSKQYYDTADYAYKLILTKDTLDKSYKQEMMRDYASFLDTRGFEYLERKRINESDPYFTQSDSILNVLIEQKDITALNLLLVVIPKRELSYAQFGDTAKIKQLQLRAANLQNQPKSEFGKITTGLQTLTTKINQLFKDGFGNNEKNTLIDTTLSKFISMESLITLEKLMYNKKKILTEKDTLEREWELDRYYAYCADSLNFENSVKKDEFCTLLTSIGNEYFGIGNSDKGLKSYVKAFQYAEQLSNRDKLGYSFLPQQYSIMNTVGWRSFIEDNNKRIQFCLNTLKLMNDTLANIDSVQFASNISEYYSLRAMYFEKLEDNFANVNEWYDYGLADSTYDNCVKEEEWLSLCRANQLIDISNSSRTLYFRKAKSIIYKIYASGLFSDFHRKELDTLVFKIRNYKLLSTFSIVNESNESMAKKIESYIEEITPEDLTKGNYHYRVQQQIDLSSSKTTYKNKVDYLLKAQKILEEASSKYPKDSVFINRKPLVFTNLSWNYLFLKKFDKSENCAVNSLKIDSSDNNLIPYTNLGHSLLYQGQFLKAKTIYEKLKGIEGQDYKAILLKDLSDLEAASITHKDVPRMKAEIEKW